MSAAEIDRLRLRLHRALGDWEHFRDHGHDNAAAGAGRRVEIYSAALLALALTEPHTSWDEHGASACRMTFREVTK